MTFLAATAAAALFATGAMASSVTIEKITASWVAIPDGDPEATGGDNLDIHNGDPDLNPNLVTVTWGNPVPSFIDSDGNNLNPDPDGIGFKSGYAFLPETTDFPAAEGVPFKLGEFFHENWAIATGGGISFIDLAFMFEGSPDGTPAELRPAASFPATFRFKHTETPNQRADCPEDAIACDDIVMVTALDGDTETVQVGKVRYTFRLLGFGDTADVAQFANVFETEEGRSNSTFLWADYTIAVIPLPAAGWLLLGGLGVMGAVARRRRKDA
jgi:hypothetical protein